MHSELHFEEVGEHTLLYQQKLTEFRLSALDTSWGNGRNSPFEAKETRFKSWFYCSLVGSLSEPQCLHLQNRYNNTYLAILSLG